MRAITKRRRAKLADGRGGKFLQDGYWVLYEGDNTEYPVPHSECGNLKELIERFIANDHRKTSSCGLDVGDSKIQQINNNVNDTAKYPLASLVSTLNEEKNTCLLKALNVYFDCCVYASISDFWEKLKSINKAPNRWFKEKQAGATTSKSAARVVVNNKVYQRVWDFQSKELRVSSLHESESEQVRRLIVEKLKIIIDKW